MADAHVDFAGPFRSDDERDLLERAEAKLEELRAILSPARLVDPMTQLLEAQAAVYTFEEAWALAAQRPDWQPSEAQRRRWKEWTS